MSARNVTAEEALALLAEYDAGVYPTDGPERPELARTVIAQAEENERLRTVVADAAANLEGEHLATCDRAENNYATCDCIVGRVRFALRNALRGTASGDGVTP